MVVVVLVLLFLRLICTELLTITLLLEHKIEDTLVVVAEAVVTPVLVVLVDKVEVDLVVLDLVVGQVLLLHNLELVGTLLVDVVEVE